MQCKICESIVNTDSENKPGYKFGSTLADGNIYCFECADVASFAQDINTTKIINTSNEINIPKEIKKEPTKQVKNVIEFYCSKCNKRASGDKCETCGNLNPLYRKKK
jgi:hypothetical protein